MIAFQNLPTRQVQVLRLCAEGLTTAEMGEQLHISESTVKTHLRSLFELWRAENRAHLVHLGYQYGVLVVAEPPAQPVQPKPAKAPPSAPPLFRKAGLVHRVVAPVSELPKVPRPRRTGEARGVQPAPKPTHTIRVVHPTDDARSWRVDVAPADGADLTQRVERLAGWLAPPFRVCAVRLGKEDEVLSVEASGRAESLAS